MNVNTQFSVATHVLVFLAKYNATPASSSYIASSVGTNPVVIRKIVQKLERAGMVGSVPGSKGGLFLSRAAEEINLWDVFQAVNGLQIFSVHETSHPQCPVGGKMRQLLTSSLEKAEFRLQQELRQVSIKTCLNSLQETAT